MARIRSTNEYLITSSSLIALQSHMQLDKIQNKLSATFWFETYYNKFSTTSRYEQLGVVLGFTERLQRMYEAQSCQLELMQSTQRYLMMNQLQLALLMILIPSSVWLRMATPFKSILPISSFFIEVAISSASIFQVNQLSSFIRLLLNIYSSCAFRIYLRKLSKCSLCAIQILLLSIIQLKQYKQKRQPLFSPLIQVLLIKFNQYLKYCNQKSTMKTSIAILLICTLITLNQCNKTDQSVLTQVTSATNKSIVLNAQNNNTKIIPTVQHNTTNTTNTPKPHSEKQSVTKQGQFTFTQGNHSQINFEKEVQAIHKNENKWQGNPELALQVQKQGQIQQQKEQEQLKQQQDQMNPWIAQQMKSLHEQIDGIVTQSLQFILDPQAQYSFRWNPPKTQQLSLSVLVFQVKDNGEIMLEQNLLEDEFIQVQSRQQGKHIYNRLGHVYVSKVFHINFDTDFKYFRFVSKIPKSVFVVVDLERLNQVVPTNIAKDKHFQGPLLKLKTIQEEILSGEKIRQHTYKYEWGFLDNQYTHDSRLLGFTGFELLVIIAAAVTQLYFIKNLLDNRAIV